MKIIFFALAMLVAALSAQAATPESYVGKTPKNLLKITEFAKAYRTAISDVELPAWTKKLGAGPAAEIVEIGGSKLVLTSACGQNGCLDERIYILFDPKTKSASGFFFLPPAADDPGDTRMAFSQWLGKPSKEASTFLLDRATDDASSLTKSNY